MSKVFHLSEAVVIGLHCSILLAENHGRLLSTREISELLNVSYDHTVQVVQRLRRAGVIGSVQGPQGGFRLLWDPAKTTLLMVYEALEGELVDQHCLFHQEKHTAHCPVFGELVCKVNQTVRNFFSNNTLKKIAGKRCRAVGLLPKASPPKAAIPARPVRRRMHIRRRALPQETI